MRTWFKGKNSGWSTATRPRELDDVSRYPTLPDVLRRSLHIRVGQKGWCVRESSYIIVLYTVLYNHFPLITYQNMVTTVKRLCWWKFGHKSMWKITAKKTKLSCSHKIYSVEWVPAYPVTHSYYRIILRSGELSMINKTTFLESRPSFIIFWMLTSSHYYLYILDFRLEVTMRKKLDRKGTEVSLDPINTLKE